MVGIGLPGALGSLLSASDLKNIVQEFCRDRDAMPPQSNGRQMDFPELLWEREILLTYLFICDAAATQRLEICPN